MSRFERLLSSYASVASRLKRGQSTRQIRYYESERLCRTRHLEEVQACASICEQRRILDKNTLFCANISRGCIASFADRALHLQVTSTSTADQETRARPPDSPQ